MQRAAIKSHHASMSSFASTMVPRNAIRTLPKPAVPRRGRPGASIVRASFFGVGAPEAVVVGVVALLVFGPKGLAEAAKSIGSAIRSFQPTIREVAQISSELKSTLEQEIGLDDLKNELKGVPPTSQPAPRAFAEDKAKEADPSIEELRRRSAEAAWGGAASAEQPAAASAVSSAPAAPAAPPPAPVPAKPVSEMSMEELEAEISRRKTAPSPAPAAPKPQSIPQTLRSDE